MSLKTAQVQDLVGTMNHSRLGRVLNHDGHFMKIIERDIENKASASLVPADSDSNALAPSERRS